MQTLSEMEIDPQEYPLCLTGQADCHDRKVVFGVVKDQAEADAYLASWDDATREAIGAKIENTADNMDTPKS